MAPPDCDKVHEKRDDLHKTGFNACRQHRRTRR